MNTNNYLNTIESPKDLKVYSLNQLEKIAQEIRAFLISTVSATGGHLSSNLGVVELTLALHYSFNSPVDSIVFDVGHQCYTHKILTGRRDEFVNLRKKDGLSGFPSQQESKHDAFIAGHGSTSLSAAIGIAQAKKLKNEPGKVIAILGDGASTGGMIYEGLNNIDDLDNLIIVLNDNNMSISKNVGAFARYLNHLRVSPKYSKAKDDIKKALSKAPLIGGGLTKSIQSIKSRIRRSVYHSTFFEEMGLKYIGPIDGHNIEELVTVFNFVKNAKQPVFIHTTTTKGKGYAPAEQNPGAFHGVSAFDADCLGDPDVSCSDSFSSVFGKELTHLAASNPSICAITAAMKYGTGLQYFNWEFPKRFFDVGMAEEHAVTFAAGLASKGLLPVVAIYSTFLQRGYDQIIHDVILQNANVLFAIDRAGLVPADGETHQGIYDAAFLSQHSAMPIVSPATYQELQFWLKELVENCDGPCAIRYSRGEMDTSLNGLPCSKNKFDMDKSDNDANIAVVTYGTVVAEVMGAIDLLEDVQKPDLFRLIWINPIEPSFIEALSKYDSVLFIEEGIKQGGIGEHVAARLLDNGFVGKYKHHAIVSGNIDHATVAELRKEHGLDAQSIAEMMKVLYNET